MTDVPSILLVEDDEDDYVLARDLLSEIYGSSLQLHRVPSWDEGLAELSHGAQDISLIDYRLGEKNGVDLVSQVVAQGYTKPTILLTGKDDRQLDIQAMKAGATDYLIKSEITATVLERAIRYAMERYKVEEALRQRENTLQSRVVELEQARSELVRQGEDMARLTADLQLAHDQALLANRTKSEFLSNMSHELRTPLNAVIGFSEILISEAFGSIGNDKYRDYIQDINASGQHLLSLINDILDLSKIEAGKVDLHEEEFDPAGVIQSCLSMVKGQARSQGLQISTEISDEILPLRADQRMLKQIIINLLSNAVKFTPEGGKITVKAWSSPSSGHVFQVIDTGIGVALEDIPKILRPFTQIEGALNRKHQGTGLGLPLVKNLVELQGGYLDFQSAIGEGTTVTVRFPKERIVNIERESKISMVAR